MIDNSKSDRRRLPEDVSRLTLEQLREWRAHFIEQKTSIEASLGDRHPAASTHSTPSAAAT